MTTIEQAEARATTIPRVAKRRRQPFGAGSVWWRHVIGVIAVVFALFPVAYIASAEIGRAHV